MDAALTDDTCRQYAVCQGTAREGMIWWVEDYVKYVKR